MKYTKDAKGRFSGQQGYGYKSLDAFVDAVLKIRKGEAKPEDFDGELPTLATTFQGTAILEAGRKSLDSGGKAVHIKYSTTDIFLPVSLE